MKNTKIDFLKSKTFWAIIALQVIALEPFVPMIKEYLPSEFSYIATIVLPIAILWAKLIRDKGLLESVNNIKPKKTYKRKSKAVEKLEKENDIE